MKRPQRSASGPGSAKPSRQTVHGDAIDPFRAQHLDLVSRDLMTDTGVLQVLVNDS